MILYLDTSVMVPLLVREPSSARCGHLWDSADAITTTRLTYIEAASALAHATRLGRLTSWKAQAARDLLDELWGSVNVIELGPDLMTLAADLAVTHALRGFDATHCAAAIMVNDSGVVAAAGDRGLLTAWRAEGLATWDANA